MKKEYIIGGLALLGAIGVVSYLLKTKAPRRNSEGFYGVTGRSSIRRVKSQNCAWCKTTDGMIYHTGEDRNCSGGDRCITRYSFSQSIN